VNDLFRFGLVPFGLGLGATVAYRLSAEAMAVVVGVVAAVVACTVMGGVMLVIVRATYQRAPAEPPRQSQYPPVMVIQPGIPTSLPQNQAAGLANPYPWPVQRAFSVVGGDEETRQVGVPRHLPW
jgi:hypothetical protein